MSDTIELRGLSHGLRRRWWLPALLAVVGVVVGVVVSEWVAPVHRAQGTLLVGPINGTVTKSTTLRASEDLAVFYADLARREVVLDTVRDQLGLSTRWDVLRGRVSAVIPDQNPRAVTITVADSNQKHAVDITKAIMARLIALSPAPVGETEQGFVSEQVDSLRATIKQAETQADHLQAAAAQETDPARRQDLAREWSAKEALLTEWRQTYVDLMAVDPTSDAGGLQVLDDVTTVGSLDRAGTVRQGLLGGIVGAILGALIVWWRSGSLTPRDVPPPTADERVDRQGADPFVLKNHRPAADPPHTNEVTRRAR